jgi:hypothetical protein
VLQKRGEPADHAALVQSLDLEELPRNRQARLAARAAPRSSADLVGGEFPLQRQQHPPLISVSSTMSVVSTTSAGLVGLAPGSGPVDARGPRRA